MPKVWPVFGLFEDDRVLEIPEDGEEPVKIVSLKEFFLVATTSGMNVVGCPDKFREDSGVQVGHLEVQVSSPVQYR
jgi:hypothetical protein